MKVNNILSLPVIPFLHCEDRVPRDEQSSPLLCILNKSIQNTKAGSKTEHENERELPYRLTATTVRPMAAIGGSDTTLE